MLSPSYEHGSSPLSTLTSASPFLPRQNDFSHHLPMEASSPSDLTNDDTNRVLSSIISSAEYSNLSPTHKDHHQPAHLPPPSLLNAGNGPTDVFCGNKQLQGSSGHFVSSSLFRNDSLNANVSVANSKSIRRLPLAPKLKGNSHLLRSSSLPTDNHPSSMNISGPKISTMSEDNTTTTTIELIPVSTDMVVSDSSTNRTGTAVLVRRIVSSGPSTGAFIKDSNRNKVVVDSQLVLSRSELMNKSDIDDQPTAMNTTPTAVLFKSASTSTLSDGSKAFILAADVDKGAIVNGLKDINSNDKFNKKEEDKNAHSKDGVKNENESGEYKYHYVIPFT